MLKNRFTLTSFFLILLMVSWFYYFMHSLVEHVMYEKIKVNNLVTLYVTQASAGAMTSFSYHYYLYDTKKSEADFMAHVKDETPFMVTSDEKATATVEASPY